MDMRILWIVAIFGAVGISANPEGYGDFDQHHHHHPEYNVVPVVKKVVDYYSKPQYAFGYEVEDYYQQLSHGRWEVRDGDVTQGQYRVLLPDGRIQIVSYIADKGGYRPTIQYIGKGVHPPPPPAYAKIKPPHHHHHLEPEVIPLEHDHGHHIPAPIPAPVPILEPKHLVPLGGPLKLDVGHIGPTGYGHSGGYGDAGYGYAGGYGHSGGYGQGYGYGGGVHYGEPLVFGPSNQKTVKVLPKGRLAKKRALLYDRTLFRRDIPKLLNHRD